MGVTSSVADKLPAGFPENEKLIGWENFGNTCYVNAVSQALYFCRPFREKLLQYHDAARKAPGFNADAKPATLLAALAATFDKIALSTRQTGTIAPEAFVKKLKSDNELFRGFEHQDAQEFLNYLLNSASDQLIADARRLALPSSSSSFVQEIFEGTLVNETKCTCCETVTTREEKFLDLSLDVQGDCSLRDCLGAFNAREMIDKADKYFCETCCLRQEAFRCMRIKQLPSVLVCHLKRFKFMENLQRFVKLSHEVRFPDVLAFPPSHYHPARTYALCAVVVHIGSGMRQGHYVAMVKAHDTWFMFDDEDVSVIPFEVVQRCYGATDAKQHYDGYLLFYN